MLTPFGKAIRKIRIDYNMKLSAMANQLDVSPTFLTAIETGRKSVPAEFPARVARLFMAAEAAIFALLSEAAEQSKMVYKLSVGHEARDQQRTVAALFARQFPELSDEKLERIMNIIDERGEMA